MIKSPLPLLLAFALGATDALFSCAADRYSPPRKRSDVEISPGRFVRIEQQDWSLDDPNNETGREKTAFEVRVGQTTVTWEGAEIPVVLREKEGTLYMVGYDRETGRLNGDNIPRYKYYRQKANALAEINRDDFPKELATQNMWLRDARRRRAVLSLDTSSTLFRSSSNAFIWEDLMRGKCTDPSGVDKALLDDFIRQFKPIKLAGAK